MDEPKKVLVVGDIMIDRYIYVSSERQSPEAPIPVWDELYLENRLGGAANVAHNLKALAGDDVEVFLAGTVGLQERRMISRLGIDTVLCSGVETMVKRRYVDEKNKKYLFRADSVKKFSEESSRMFYKTLDHFLTGHVFDAVVFSDYNKGTIDTGIVDALRMKAGLCVVDSKRIDLTMYAGMQVLKINELEHAAQIARGPYVGVEGLFDYVVVTHGGKGAELRQYDHVKSGALKYVIHSENFSVQPVKNSDVTGCGDTHTAAMTFSLLKNKDMRLAVKFANVCASDVAKKFGTSISDVLSVNNGV